MVAGHLQEKNNFYYIVLSYKDETGKCVMSRLPGLLQPLTGTDIPEYTFVSPADGTVYADWDGVQIEACIFNDLLEPLTEQARVEARYVSSYYAGTPALISNAKGKGRVFYFGGAFHEHTARVFLEKLGVAQPYGDILALPEGCELTVRESTDQSRYFFVMNYLEETAEICLKEVFLDLFEGKEAEGKLELPPYGTKVLAKINSINR